MVSKPIRCIASVVDGDRERVENGSSASVTGAAVGGKCMGSAGAALGESRVTFEELGWESSSCPFEISALFTGSALERALEGRFLFLLSYCRHDEQVKSWL